MSANFSFKEHTSVRPLWAEVSLDVITSNLNAVRERMGQKVKIITPVKADAYGHGIVEVGKHLESLGVDGLATANFDDALALRENGVKLPILIYASHLPEGVETLLKYDLTPTVVDIEMAKAISRYADKTVNVHVKVDAGLGRLGVKLSQAHEFILEVSKLENIEVEGVYTHIAFSSPEGEKWSKEKLAAFTSLIDAIEKQDGLHIKYAQASASATISCGFSDTLNTISPGHLMFGLCPVEPHLADMTGFEYAMRKVKARLIQVIDHEAGDDLAVFGVYNLQHKMRTGVILFGKDNGFHKPADGKGYMLCHGQKCPILSVTAEYTVLDISHVPNTVVGDEVTIIGEDESQKITLGDVADYLETTTAVVMLDLRRIPIYYTKGVTS